MLAKLILSPSAAHQFKLTAESLKRQNDTDILSFFGDPFAAATLTDVDVRENITRDLGKLDYRYAPTNTWFDILTANVYAQTSLNSQYGFEARSASAAGAHP